MSIRILETGVARARYILRLIPIVATCKVGAVWSRLVLCKEVKVIGMTLESNSFVKVDILPCKSICRQNKCVWAETLLSQAHEKNIEETLSQVLGPFFPPGSSTSYSVIFKVRKQCRSHTEILKTRNNGSVGREEVIKMVGNVVRNLDGESSVDLKSPDLAIIVEVSIFPRCSFS